MNRFGAFAVHLGISLVIFVILGYLILFHWYPDFFFRSDGGWQGIRIIALVDLVLGPVLTLVVYKKGKPSLKFDLTAIAIFQALCLTAGVWVVFSERPVAMVFADGSFQSMTVDDYVSAGRTVPDFSRFPGPAPYRISVKFPDDPEEQAKIRRELITRQESTKTASEFYVPFDPTHIDLERDGITELEQQRIGLGLFEQFVSKHGGQIEDYVFIPFGTRYEPALLALRIADGELIYLGVPLALEETEETEPAS